VLLQLITRWHLFKLLVGDYLSMPLGKGGYHTIGLYLDTFLQHMWVFKYKTAGTAKTTVDAVSTVTKAYIPPETFMTDSGSHFNNIAVWEYCKANGIKKHITPAYSPWVNGLVEGLNKILLHVLKWLCVLDVGEQDNTEGWEKLPKHWLHHLDNAVKALNHCILPALKFSPKELLLGIAINMPRTEPKEAVVEPSTGEAAIHIAYVAQQHLDGYKVTVKHTITCK
jgi:transposase InsO family protein